jgi:hypothetical protein
MKNAFLLLLFFTNFIFSQGIPFSYWNSNFDPKLTLTAIKPYYITSVSDSNYLPYSMPTSAANTNINVNPDLTTETTTIDIQGSLSTTGVSIYIPYQVSSGTISIPAYSYTTTVSMTNTQEGTANIDVNLSYPAQTLGTAGSLSYGSIVATLKAVSATLNVKKLDINSGIGSSYSGILLATFPYKINSSGTIANFLLRGIPVIPDRNVNDTSHRMFYAIVSDEYGQNWLNNNLGANYSNISKAAVFNPIKKATSKGDYNAYGSLFQWGRYSDGHELFNWFANNAGTAVVGTTTTRYDSPPSPYSYISNTDPGDWRLIANGQLWQNDLNETNNPCPYGFLVPANTDFDYIENGKYGSYYQTRDSAASSILAFPLAGRRNGTGSYASGNAEFLLWNRTTSQQTSSRSYYMAGGNIINPGSTFIRSYGMSVRCIKK